MTLTKVKKQGNETTKKKTIKYRNWKDRNDYRNCTLIGTLNSLICGLNYSLNGKAMNSIIN